MKRQMNRLDRQIEQIDNEMNKKKEIDKQIEIDRKIKILINKEINRMIKRQIER